MAYTYDDFLSAANKSGMLEGFSQEDLTTTQKYPEFGLSLLTLKQDASKATTPEAKLLAQEAESQLRKTYSSVTGAVHPWTQTGEAGNENLQQPSGGSFQYDPETDPRFAAYKKAYLREGDRAAENALAKASVLTGGVPSTAAITASQQAGDYYAAKLADIIPELYADAYSKNITERQLQADQEQQKIANALNLYKTLGYATPEIAQILGLQTSAGDQQTGSDDTSSAKTDTPSTATNWDNGGYSRDQIAKLQTWLGVDADGLFGPVSKAALAAKGYSSLQQVMLEEPWLQGPNDGGNGGTGAPGITEPGSLEGTLSASGQNFMKSLPMPSPTTKSEDWKSFVNKRLKQAYESGSITSNDVVIITQKLGL